MDAFYASVEQRDDPSLRGLPVIVGGPSKRGVVCAASYEARPFGVRSAMPMVEALRRCPEARVVGVRHARYAEVSREIFGIFHRYTPLVEGLSLDEAFLDVTASESLFGDGPSIARRIKAEVLGELDLKVSIGVATSKFIAKIASDLRKPDALVVVPPGEERAFLAPLPIERVWGIGPKAAERLHRAGVRTIAQLERLDDRRLQELLGNAGAHLAQLARGVDTREVIPDRQTVSIGAEDTFEQDLRTRPEIEAELLAQSCRVASRLSVADRSGRVVVVKIKHADFTIVSRRVALPAPVRDADSIYEAARELLGRFDLDTKPVRLTGVTVTELSQGEPPRLLFEDPRADKRRRLQGLVDQVERRFGDDAITRATLATRRRR